MKILLLESIFIATALAIPSIFQTRPPSKSLDSLLSENVKKEIINDLSIFHDLEPVFRNVDWDNDTASSEVLSSVPCNNECVICWAFNSALAVDKCEDHCEKQCNWNFEEGFEEGDRSKRGAIDICLGIPELIRVNFLGLDKIIPGLLGKR